MTVVNPKSISGINSITMASGSDNLLTIHTTNTTERVRVNSDGDVIVGSGITVSPDGDIFATGVTTSTTFVGALTGNVTGNISGGTVAGSTGTFTGDVDIADKIIHTGDTDTAIRFSGADTVSVETAGSSRLAITSGGIIQVQDSVALSSNAPSVKGKIRISGVSDATTAGGIEFHTSSGGGGGYGSRITADASGNMHFLTRSNSAAWSEKTRINSDGDVTIVDGDLVIGTAGHGIDFSATADSSGTKENELLDDYEEGTFTPTLEAASNPSMSYTNQGGKYTKIGNLVYVTVDLRWSGRSGGSGNAKLGGLPFTSSSSQPYTGGIVFEKNKLTSHADEAIISVEVGSNQAFATFLSTVHDDSGSTSGLVIGNFQNASGYFMISFNYFTN